MICRQTTSGKPFLARAIVAAAVAAVLAACAGCAGRADSGRWVHQAIEKNRLADRALAERDTATAVALLRDLARRQAPAAVSARDGRVVRQDACFRLALLQLEAGQPAQALRWADYGLELGSGQDLFTANLLIARGHANQALGNDKPAARAYHRALRINEELMNQALGRTD